jgi:MFS family permease
MIATLNGFSMLVGMSLIGITTFLPMYVLVVLGRSPVVAGLALTMVMLGWPLGATLTSRVFHRIGLWRMVLLGSVLMPVGALAFALLRPDGSPVLAGIGSFVIGLGMGVLSLSSLILIQEAVEVSQRGVATASNIFARNLGSAVGAAFFGAIFNFGLSRANGGAMISEEQLHRLLQGRGATLAETGLQTAMAGSLQLTFLVMLVVTLGIVVMAVSLPRQGLGLRLDTSATRTEGNAIPPNLH